jgi:effector-binding domain-containing protein
MPSITLPETIDSPGGATAGIRQWVSFEEFGPAIGASADEVIGWLAKHGSEPKGPLYIRYHVINMPRRMEVEIGFFIDPGPASEGRVTVGETPAGKYVRTNYTGHYDGLMTATGLLIGWAKEAGIVWDAWDTPEGQAFASRLELYHTDPDENPDPETWVTEIAIKTKE